MRFVPMLNIRSQLTITILCSILVSWICSVGVNHYLTFRELTAFRRIMLAHPAMYPNPIPPQRFGVREFLFGYPPRLPRPVTASAQAPQPNVPVPLSPEQVEHQRMIAGATAFIVLGIALLAGWLASYRFTRPLSLLMTGVRAMQAGDLAHPIRVTGDSEYAQLAATLTAMGARVSDHIARLEREALTRRHFMADIAHEFRTPLTTLQTMAAALEEGVADDPDRRRRAARSIARTSDRLLRLVNDMLELVKLDLHELPLHKQPVDARELIASCLQAHADSAVAAGLTLQPGEAGEPVMVDADPDRLAQVLDNLITNAISYAGTGAMVAVTLEAGPPHRITVRDTGKGIPVRHLPFICEPFYRVDAARTPGDTHCGLGLRIARALIEAHGGSLELQSTEGTGTTVTILLP